MTRYEKITSLNDEFLSLIQVGFIPLHLLDWKVYYEAYLQEIKKSKTSEAINMIAANYDVSRRQVQRIVAYMES
ncbi:hypothetical protein Q765_03290 [Flavobacterium rivuli WB 3.3-2 = DSM 21788]|uniref:Uncharacterized protein n=1 Tax=Flavobacterium rivuli WB 3.3-2 = DSM 21788 TaxID=1121895 RepID=A0A0A2M600_9FLAO|nr:hypothetical protein [Flavobacterium rivuli]KGO88092.1 hypothetical protein Q765_03290 [Flavobacterium rivuli WB 3.3-2 = DSM 21788]